ncbi:SAM-dependent methyltransferase [Ornithobacterium rhinotracheale]|uniref:SAM-dependent methyltransferase n=2 Tax=Ornithobacterium rhinotracheale TaxID=28251 RepID=A0A3R5UVN7_ORNRH|nr:SAM-dependent methyltransferase [Ornithobacterium rhinotracheale]
MSLSKSMTASEHNQPCLYLIPTLLGDDTQAQSIPPYNLHIIEAIWHFCVENEKSARRFIKSVAPKKKQADLKIEILNKNTPPQEIPSLLSPLREGHSVGILSEAGMPGIADPGAMLVQAAHREGIRVVPLVGPSSIFLALASSGFNGQSFSFHGYLPIDKRERRVAIKQVEQESLRKKSAEIFIETPYRNNQMLEDLISTLNPNTQLCVACDITLPSELIFSASIKKWRQKKADLHKRPAIFIIQA